MNFCVDLQVRTIDDVLGAPTPQLSSLKRGDDKSVPLSILIELIAEVRQNLNVGKNMNNAQVVKAAQMLYDAYWWYKPEDFKLCFQKLIAGEYGKQYDVLDVQVLLQACRQYDLERVEALEEKRRAERLERENQAIDASERTEEDQQKWQEFSRVMNSIQIKQVDPKPVPVRVLDIWQRWLIKFDELWRKRGNKALSVKFIKRGGKMLSSEDFLKYKHAQLLRVARYLETRA